MATAIGELGREQKRPLFARRPVLRPGERDLPLQKNRRRRVLRLKHVLALARAPGRASSRASARPISSSSPGTSWPSARSRSSAPSPTSARPCRTISPCRAWATSSSATSRPCGATSGAWPGSRTRASRRSSPRPCGSRSSRGRRSPSSSAAASVSPTRRATSSSRSIPSRNTASPSSPTRPASPPASTTNGKRPAGATGACPRPNRPGSSASARTITAPSSSRFKDDPVRVVVGRGSPAEDLALFRGRRAEWEEPAGPLAVVDMSYDGRVYLRAAEPPAGDAVTQPDQGD